jgi:hypothetical protein
MRLTVFAVMLLASTTMAFAQGNAPFVPVNPADTAPASALDDMPSKTISNGLVSAKVFLPDPFGFYRSTRFDHAGMITHITYKGQDYGRYWFVKTSPDVKNFTYDQDGLVAHPSDVAAGPVEEFAQNGFDEAGPCRETAKGKECGRFLKIGVGILKRDNDTYDRFHTYPIVNPGKRTTTATKSSIRFTQMIAGDPSGYGYSYTKTVRLTPGKAQLVIEDRLKNTGKKAIDTTVYNHHFMTLSPGEEAVQLEAPFALAHARPMPADVVKFDGNRMTYLRGITGQEQVASDLTGFTNAVADNDFKVTNTKTGYGVRLRASMPVTRLLWWSVPSTMGIEPYMDVKLKPGEEKVWTHTLDYYGPGDAK